MTRSIKSLQAELAHFMGMITEMQTAKAHHAEAIEVSKPLREELAEWRAIFQSSVEAKDFSAADEASAEVKRLEAEIEVASEAIDQTWKIYQALGGHNTMERHQRAVAEIRRDLAEAEARAEGNARRDLVRAGGDRLSSRSRQRLNGGRDPRAGQQVEHLRHNPFVGVVV